MKDALNPNQRLGRTETVLETQLDGEVVLMSMEAGHCFGLDAIGSEIWQALQTPASLAQLQGLCRDRYEGDPDQIDRDVTSLVTQLLAEGLVVPTA